jgi:hypothetical protein
MAALPDLLFPTLRYRNPEGHIWCFGTYRGEPLKAPATTKGI